MKAGYLYCPYCGTEWKSPLTLEKALDQGLAPLEVQEADRAIHALMDLEAQLDQLDSELEVFLSHSV